MLEEARKKPPLEALEGNGAAYTLISASCLLNWEAIHMCSFKPPSLWYFVKAALEKEYRFVKDFEFQLLYLKKVNNVLVINIMELK